MLLLRIEIVLRECLKHSLESQSGVDWQKKLPGDILTKIRKAQTDENKPQFNFVRLGPLYYLTFPELLPLLQQKSGRSVAEKLGGDTFLKQFENIFAPRNAVCHSRPVSSVGLKTIETLYAQMEAALTSDGLASLMATPDTGMTQDEAAKGIILDTVGMKSGFYSGNLRVRAQSPPAAGHRRLTPWVLASIGLTPQKASMTPVSCPSRSSKSGRRTADVGRVRTAVGRVTETLVENDGSGTWGTSLRGGLGGCTSRTRSIGASPARSTSMWTCRTLRLPGRTTRIV